MSKLVVQSLYLVIYFFFSQSLTVMKVLNLPFANKKIHSGTEDPKRCQNFRIKVKNGILLLAE